MERALAVIDKWGAQWVDAHSNEEGTDNNPDQWCIGGDFFDASSHDVIQEANAFADKYPNA